MSRRWARSGRRQRCQARASPRRTERMKRPLPPKPSSEGGVQTPARDLRRRRLLLLKERKKAPTSKLTPVMTSASLIPLIGKSHVKAKSRLMGQRDSRPLLSRTLYAKRSRNSLRKHVSKMVKQFPQVTLRRLLVQVEAEGV